jgi:hypothetical protein
LIEIAKLIFYALLFRIMEFIDLVEDMIHEISSHLNLQDKGFLKASCKYTNALIIDHGKTFISSKYYCIAYIIKQHIGGFLKVRHRKNRKMVSTKVGCISICRKTSDYRLCKKFIMTIDEMRSNTIKWFRITLKNNAYAVAVIDGNQIAITKTGTFENRVCVRINYDQTVVNAYINISSHAYQEQFERSYFDGFTYRLLGI